MNAPNPASADNLVLPFQVEKTGARGRIVRLGSVMDTILRAHNQPEPVSMVMGEGLLVAALLGSSLKSEGGLTLQTHTDGPVSLMVSSYRAPGSLRGYAAFDEAQAATVTSPKDVLGEGRLALTIDPGAGLNRYQGVVNLGEGGLLQGIHDYFQYSEQIATRLVLAVGRLHIDGSYHWRAGGILVQHMAADGGHTDEEERLAREAAEGVAMTEGGEPVEEAWARVTALLETTEHHELLDPMITPETLLYRLFHEDGVRVFDKMPLEQDCRCTRKRLLGILNQYADDGFDDLLDEGKIKMRCEFCNKEFQFDPADLSPAKE